MRLARQVKTQPIAMHGHNQASDAMGDETSEDATICNPEWRRAESNRGPRDYETLALAY